MGRASAASSAAEKSSTSRKRPRSRENGSTSTSKNPTLGGSVPREGEVLVLFETPSGFAIFCMKYYYLRQQNAKNIWTIFGKDYRSREIIWLKEFQAFKDKSSAISHNTGVSKELSEMILRHHRPGQKLAVGNRKYKRIIEKSLADVPCLFNRAMNEVVWGLKNLMHSLVPQEDVKLTKEERMPMCRGILKFLDLHGFDVKPEMVNEMVVETACLLFDAELVERKHSEFLQCAADWLKGVSGINLESWDEVKIAKALKIMFEPIETTGAEIEMFTREELLVFVEDEYKSNDQIRQVNILKIHNELLEALEVKRQALEILRHLLS